MTLLNLIDARPDRAIQDLIDSLVTDAKTLWDPQEYEGWYPTKGFGITELAPFHLHAGGTGWGSSNFWAASIAASSTWQDWMNHSQTDAAYAIITGVFNREPVPKATYLRPNPGGQDLPSVNLEQLYTLDIARAFFEQPWAVRPKSPCKLRIKGDNTGVERIGLTGYGLCQLAYIIKES